MAHSAGDQRGHCIAVGHVRVDDVRAAAQFGNGVRRFGAAGREIVDDYIGAFFGEAERDALADRFGCPVLDEYSSEELTRGLGEQLLVNYGTAYPSLFLPPGFQQWDDEKKNKK